MEQFRLFIRVVLFAGFAAVVYVLLLALVPEGLGLRVIRNLNVFTGHEGHALTRYREASSRNSAQVLFLGSSLTYRGYDTRIFSAAGIDAFNLGSSAQTPLQSEVLLARYLDRLAPDLVVLSLDPRILNNSGVESALDILANTPVDEYAFGMALHVNHLRTWNTLIYSFIKQSLFGPTKHIESLRMGKNTYIPGGFVERDLEFAAPATDSTTKSQEPSRIQELEMVDHMAKQLAAIQRMTTALKEKRVAFVIVEPPVPSVRRASYSDHGQFEALMRSFGPYVDMHTLSGMNDRLHFYDDVHLNQHGVELFNAALIERLEHEGLP